MVECLCCKGAEAMEKEKSKKAFLLCLPQARL